MQLITERLTKTFQDIHAAITEEVNKIQSQETIRINRESAQIEKKGTEKCKQKQSSKERKISKSQINEKQLINDEHEKQDNNNQAGRLGVSEDRSAMEDESQDKADYNDNNVHSNEILGEGQNKQSRTDDRNQIKNQKQALQAIAGQTPPQKKPVKKSKKPLLPIIQKPKKPQNSFKIYLHQMKKQSSNNSNSPDNQQHQNLLLKQATKRWQNMSNQQKQIYEQLQLRQNQQYLRRLQEYYQLNPQQRVLDSEKKGMKQEKKKAKLAQKNKDKQKDKEKQKQKQKQKPKNKEFAEDYDEQPFYNQKQTNAKKQAKKFQIKIKPSPLPQQPIQNKANFNNNSLPPSMIDQQNQQPRLQQTDPVNPNPTKINTNMIENQVIKNELEQQQFYQNQRNQQNNDINYVKNEINDNSNNNNNNDQINNDDIIANYLKFKQYQQYQSDSLGDQF